eukprot:EG_transcript_24727
MKPTWSLLARAMPRTSFWTPMVPMAPMGPVGTWLLPWRTFPLRHRFYVTPAGDGRITFVKKVLSTGSPCRKCVEVAEKLQATGQIKYIDRTVIAHEADPQSEGMVLAKKHNLTRAPFFLVDKADGTTDVYPVYMKFVKEVLGKADLEEERKERLREGSQSAADFI